MSHKTPKIASLIEGLQGQGLDAHYVGFFDCFNRQLYFEAHEVLEELWLGERKGPRDGFYKGLIQLAGAFVHLQKRRLQPAAALFRLARHNLEAYPTPHERLDIESLVKMIDSWLSQLAIPGASLQLLDASQFPKLSLLPATS